MVKKKIIIVSHALEIGGAERSLIGLLEAFDYDKYQVDLFLCRHQGELLNDIPKEVNLLPEISAYTVLARPMKAVLREGHILSVLVRLYAKVMALKFERKNKKLDSAVEIEYSQKYLYPFLPDLSDDEYDFAISFLTPHYIVPNKVKAKKCLAWIHTDYQKISIDVNSESKMWEKYDYIASISESVTESFKKVFPLLERKIVLIENILPASLIRRQSKMVKVTSEMPCDSSIRILSVGRYCNAKNFDSIPEICSRIISLGMKVKWYIIGYGNDENLIRSKIQDFQMENNVILLGKKENPYPYMRACDVYIQPSRYEGKCVSVREAQLLCKPVIITEYATSKSQLRDGVDGIIVPLDIVECANRISDIILDQSIRDRLVANCSNYDYANLQEINKLYELIE